MRYIHLLFIALIFLGCSSNNVTIDNSLGKFFKQNRVEGCFALYNNSTNEFTMYNLERYRDSAFLPASTFKVINSLIGLQTGVITNDSMVIKWDGIDRGRPECNKDLTMYDAFRISCPPYYQEVARRIGKDTMQHWIDSLSYGNKKISRVDTFWLDNSLKVRPDEQLGLMKRLFFDQLPFFKTYQETVKRAMLFEDKPQYRLYYKTGWGFKENGNSLAWCIGWIEENKHPYFFVLNLETADKKADIPTIRMNILKGILAQLDFMKGER
jgi:beta-lactamase class D